MPITRCLFRSFKNYFALNLLTKTNRTVRLADQLGTCTFWILEIDGQEITRSARPFTASDEELILNECEQCAHCGMPEVAARRFESNSVLWYVNLDDGYQPSFPRDKIFLFDSAAYEQLVGGTVTTLPEFSSADALDLLRYLKLPDWHTGLYTIPELPDDLSGQAMLRLIAESLASGGFEVLPGSEFTLTRDTSELRIGLDLPDVPEVIVRFRSTSDCVWFQLAQNPGLPIWFSHPEVTRVARLVIDGR